MQKNKLITFILIFSIALTTFFSFSVSYADGYLSIEGVTPEEIKERLQNLQTENPLEMTVSEFLLAVGDFVMDYATFLYKDEITIDRLVFNKIISLNANYFAFEKKRISTRNHGIYMRYNKYMVCIF